MRVVREIAQNYFSAQFSLDKHDIVHCRMTNYKLLRWLVETRSHDVDHNRTLHSWACHHATCTCCTCNMFP